MKGISTNSVSREVSTDIRTAPATQQTWITYMMVPLTRRASNSETRPRVHATQCAQTCTSTNKLFSARLWSRKYWLTKVAVGVLTSSCVFSTIGAKPVTDRMSWDNRNTRRPTYLTLLMGCICWLNTMNMWEAMRSNKEKEDRYGAADTRRQIFSMHRL